MGLRERFGLIVESIQGCSDDEYTTAWIDALLQAVCADEDGQECPNCRMSACEIIEEEGVK